MNRIGVRIAVLTSCFFFLQAPAAQAQRAARSAQPSTTPPNQPVARGRVINGTNVQQRTNTLRPVGPSNVPRRTNGYSGPIGPLPAVTGPGANSPLTYGAGSPVLSPSFGSPTSIMSMERSMDAAAGRTQPPTAGGQSVRPYIDMGYWGRSNYPRYYGGGGGGYYGDPYYGDFYGGAGPVFIVPYPVQEPIVVMGPEREQVGPPEQPADTKAAKRTAKAAKQADRKDPRSAEVSEQVWQSSRQKAEQIRGSASSQREKLHQLMVEGTKSFAAGKYGDAAETFLRVTMADRGNPDATLAYAIARFATGDYTNSALAIRRGVSRYPQVIASKFDIASRYTNKNDLASHIAKLDEYIKQNPTEPDALVVQGFVQHFTGRRDQAEQTFEKLIQSSRGDVPLAELFLDSYDGQPTTSAPADDQGQPAFEPAAEQIRKPAPRPAARPARSGAQKSGEQLITVE